jgi:glutaredoxin
MARGTKTVVYGIPNCDTVKKARVWLAEHGVEFEFHDFKKAGVTEPLVQDWLKDVKLDALLNRRGTTWRNAAGSDRVDDPQAVGNQASGAGGQWAGQVARFFRGRVRGAVCVSLRLRRAELNPRSGAPTERNQQQK